MLKKKENSNTVKTNPSLVVREYFVKDENPNMGLAVASLNGEYGHNKNNDVDQIIFIIEGSFRVETDQRTYDLTSEDALLIKRGTWYYVSGRGKFIAFTNPAWYFEQYEMREKANAKK